MKIIIFILILVLALPYVFKILNYYIRNRKKKEVENPIYEAIAKEGEESTEFLIKIVKLKK